MKTKLLINRNFAFLWIGKITSQIGDKFYAIALAWWILQKTDSPGIMGCFLAVSAIPCLVLGFFAGALVDRLNRKNVLIVTDILRGSLTLSVVILSFLKVLEIWHVFVIGAGLSLITAFFDPAIQALIPQIVDKDKLKDANNQFKKLGYRIKIWDAYRPTAVQKILWNKIKDNRYIANPNSGSVHNRGAAVDITLVDKNGKEISMPTDFDGFTKLADKNYSDVDKEKVKNAKLLESIMLAYGFESIYTEWWHFDDKDWKNYAVIDKVLAANVNAVYDNTKTTSTGISGDVSVNSELDFIEKIKAGINNIDIENMKIQFEYEITKFKNIFSDYKTNE
jgi:D-alanyl-D-alanine dipeptidase